MKELCVKSGAQKLLNPSWRQMTMILGLIVLMVLLNGCASTSHVGNVRSKSDLKPGEKVLAGRFACFENDAPVHCTKSEFLIFFNREGDVQAKLFSPDDAGYVYTAVPEGYYYIAPFAKGTKDGKGVITDLDPTPGVLVRSEDSIVNFGTFEVRFYQKPGAGEQPQLRVDHKPNFDVTRSEIASRVGKFGGTITDSGISLQKARR